MYYLPLKTKLRITQIKLFIAVFMACCFFQHSLRADAGYDSLVTVNYNTYTKQSLKYYELFKKAALEAESEKKYGAAEGFYRKLGVLANWLGDYDECTKFLLKSIELNKTYSSNRKGLAMSYSLLGFSMKNQNLKEGMAYMEKAIQIQEALNDSMELTSTYDNYGELLRYDGRLDSAIIFYNKSLNLKRKVNDINGIPFSLNKLGNAYRIKGKFDLAIAYLDTSQSIREELDNDFYFIENDIEYGQIYEDWGKFDIAINYFVKAYNRSQEIPYPKALKDCANRLSELYSKKNNFQKAFQYKNLYQHYKDSIENVSTQRTRDAMLMKYETVEKEKKIAEQEAKIVTAELAQRKRLNIIFIIVLVAIAIIITLAFIARYMAFMKEKAVQDGKLELQNEKVRLSRDLHDNIGAELTLIAAETDAISSLTTDEKVKQELKELRNYSTSAMHQLRETIWAIHDKEIDIEGFILKYKQFKMRLVQPYGIKAEYEKQIDNSDVIIKPSKVINLFRVCQEAVNNACKYSGASYLKTTFMLSGNLLSVKVKDNGKGFDLQSVRRGNGLENMKFRIEEIGGSIEFSSNESGTEILIRLPL